MAVGFSPSGVAKTILPHLHQYYLIPSELVVYSVYKVFQLCSFASMSKYMKTGSVLQLFWVKTKVTMMIKLESIIEVRMMIGN